MLITSGHTFSCTCGYSTQYWWAEKEKEPTSFQTPGMKQQQTNHNFQQQIKQCTKHDGTCLRSAAAAVSWRRGFLYTCSTSTSVSLAAAATCCLITNPRKLTPLEPNFLRLKPWSLTYSLQNANCQTFTLLSFPSCYSYWVIVQKTYRMTVCCNSLGLCIQFPSMVL